VHLLYGQILRHKRIYGKGGCRITAFKRRLFEFRAALNTPSKAPRSAAKWRVKRGLFEERSDEFRSAAI